MNDVLEFLIAYGYFFVFGWVLAGQAGIPLPVVPLLIAAGALCGAGHLDFATVIALSVLATLLADGAWFWIGRRHGRRVLGFLCKMALEPDSCVRTTEDRFARRGLYALVIAKFIPGLSTVAPPLAGASAMTFRTFLLIEVVAALLWTLAFALPGFLLSGEIEKVTENVSAAGTWLLVALLASVVLYIAVKLLQRQLFFRQLRMARITPQDLKVAIDEGCNLMVVDLRHAADFDLDPLVIPGALRVAADELAARHHEIPRNRDIVLYCT